jgi:hypothetical protein
VLAALTLTVSVGAASAHEFVASKLGTITTTNESIFQSFHADFDFECAKVTGEAKITALKSETLKETIKYTECIGPGVPVELSPAYYEFNANGTAKLEKPLMFNMETLGCEEWYEKQTLKGLSYKNTTKGLLFDAQSLEISGYGTGGTCGGFFKGDYYGGFYTKLTGGTLEWK